ncbi:hypothetical protein A2U01_0028587, partial [Trifolium medium]|nr:hypothetical protein [Trifolium medium]
MVFQVPWKPSQLTEFPPPPKPPDANLILTPPSNTTKGSMDTIVLPSCVKITVCPPPVWENVSVSSMLRNIESLATLLVLSKPLTITSILPCLSSQQATVLLSNNSTFSLGLLTTLDISLVVIVVLELSPGVPPTCFASRGTCATGCQAVISSVASFKMRKVLSTKTLTLYNENFT